MADRHIYHEYRYQSLLEAKDWSAVFLTDNGKAFSHPVVMWASVKTKVTVHEDRRDKDKWFEYGVVGMIMHDGRLQNAESTEGEDTPGYFVGYCGRIPLDRWLIDNKELIEMVMDCHNLTASPAHQPPAPPA